MTLERHDKPIPCARALHPFQGQSDVELSFDAGVSIQLLRRVDENWLEGRLNGRVGIFPGNHVRVELGSPSLSHESNLAGSGKPLGIALNDFSGECAGDLPLKKGDLVELIGSAGNGWMRGRLKGLEGIFPTSFVEVLQPRRSSAPPTLNQEKPYAPVPLPRTKKLSNTEQKLSSLTANLEIERKMLESAEKLTTICSTEKLQQLETEVSNHKETIQRLQQQIEETEVEKSRLVDGQTSIAPSLPSLPPNKVNKALAMEELMKNVKKEMIETEKDFYSQMDLLATRFLPLIKQRDGVNLDSLMTSILDMRLISGDLLHSLEREETIPTAFLSVAPRLRDTYGAYCKNHESHITNLEKLLEDPSVSVSISNQMGTTSHIDSISWELQSLLIKPVQRVLKYPLLLEKLLKATPPSHPDQRRLLQALEAAQQVAQDINEFKRRKDLVEKYTSGERRPTVNTVNMHSLQKKVRRFGQSIRQLTGLSTKTIDTRFDEVEHKVVAMEALVTTLLKDTQEWQDSVKELPRCLSVFQEGMQLYCSTVKVFTDYTHYVMEVQHLAQDHVEFVDIHVMGPLRSLLTLFQNPLLLIAKRHDKLLDYDHRQRALEHADEHERITLLREECLLAKRNYDALNTQLLDDLPHFLRICTSLVNLTLSVFLQGQYSFHDAICGLLGPIAFEAKSSLECVTTADLKESHTMELAAACTRLAQLSITPASLLLTGGITRTVPGGSGTTEGEEDKEGTPQEDAPKQALGRTGAQQCEVGSKLLALFDFEAQTEAELSLSEGEVVILMVPHDKVGSPDWWLVESEQIQHKTGYVPASYLSLLEHDYSIPQEGEDEAT